MLEFYEEDREMLPRELDCRYGHVGCSYSEGGPCDNEVNWSGEHPGHEEEVAE